jgi:dimethylhistidine N-methyltransferase
MAQVSLIRAATPDDEREAFAADVRRGLTAARKTLPCRWFYDETGSALFEEICELPEYPIPRAERQILERHAGEMVRPRPRTLIELGSGNSAKTRLLLDALDGHAARYVPIDISESMLASTAGTLAADYPRLEIVALSGTYEQGLARLDGHAIAPRLVLWLGSNVGNFTRPAAAAFLFGVRRNLAPGDGVLMGVDLRKDPALLHAAYDDARGVTARFNLNLLARINRELGGNFDLQGFAHRAEVHVEEGRVSMHLWARRPARVRIAALELEVAFAEGEDIHTEDSYKYSPGEIADLAATAGFAIDGDWRDSTGGFAEVRLLCRAG